MSRYTYSPTTTLQVKINTRVQTYKHVH